jgi:hypothetical protein
MASFRIFLANLQYISLLTVDPFSWKYVIVVLLMLHETLSMTVSADGVNQNFLFLIVKTEVIFWLSCLVLAWVYCSDDWIPVMIHHKKLLPFALLLVLRCNCCISPEIHLTCTHFVEFHLLVDKIMDCTNTYFQCCRLSKVTW